MDTTLPLESNVFLISEQSQDPELLSDSKHQDSEYRSAAVGVIICLVAMGVIALTTFMVLQMSRSGDTGIGDYEGIEKNDEGGRGGEGEGADLASARRKRTTWRSRIPRTRTPYRYTLPTLLTWSYSPRYTRRTRTTTTTTTTREPTTRFPLTGPQLAAYYLNMSLNWSYNPCDDFYSFVCNRFGGAKHAFDKVQYRISRENQDVLLKTRVPPSGQNAAQKGAAMFKGCVRIGSNASISQVETIKGLFRRLGLDVSNMPSDPNFDIVDPMVQLSFVYGMPALVEFKTFTLPHYPLYVLLKYHREDENWIINHYVFAENDESHAGFYGSIIRLYDPSLDTRALGRRIVQSEHLVRLYVEKEKQTALTILTNVSNLALFTENSVPRARWEDMLTTHSNHTFNTSSRVMVLENMTGLVELLMDNNRVARDDSRLLVAWCVLHRLVALSHGQEMIRTANDKYYKNPRAVGFFCYEELIPMMELALTKRYISKSVPRSTLAAVRRLLQDMIRALKRKLVNTPWFKDPLRTVAMRKAKRFRIVVGYPKEFYKNSEVEALYAEYPDVGEDFIKAYLQIKRLLAHRGLKGNETKYLEISLPNASYQFGRHLITINVGMMHPPFYIVGSPAAINYGAIGQVLCHEVMHAFDVLGITKDHRGLRIKVNDTETMQEYEKRVLCLRRSYQRAESELRARSLAHKTDSEGLADYAGILLAYDAFRELPFRNRTQTVPSVGLNAEQTFFVAHCIKWCQEDKTSRVREDQALYWNLRSRCIVPLQNMPEFANAFSCKPGDYMNPAERCEFW